MPTVSSVGMTVSSYFSSLSLLFPFPSPSFPFSLSLFPFFPFSPSPFLSFPLFSSSHFFFPFSSFLFSPKFNFSLLLFSSSSSPSLAFISRLPFPRFLPRVSPLSLTRARIHYFILLPFFPAPSLAGFLPSFFALRAPNFLPSQPEFAFLQPESNFFRMFSQKTSANIWWNGKVGVPLHPQTRKGHPCGAGAVTYARSASLVQRQEIFERLANKTE